jgi:hypothetical protein
MNRAFTQSVSSLPPGSRSTLVFGKPYSSLHISRVQLQYFARMVVRKALNIGPPSISSSIRESYTSHTFPKSPAHPIFSRSFIKSLKSPWCGGMSGQMRLSVIFVPVSLRAMAADSGRASLLLREQCSSFSGNALLKRKKNEVCQIHTCTHQVQLRPLLVSLLQNIHLNVLTVISRPPQRTKRHTQL